MIDDIKLLEYARPEDLRDAILCHAKEGWEIVGPMTRRLSNAEVCWYITITLTEPAGPLDAGGSK